MSTRFSALLLAAALIAGACGSDGASTSEETGSVAESSSAAVTETTAAPTTAAPTTAAPTTAAPTTTTAPTTTVDVNEQIVAQLQAAIDSWRAENGAPAVSLSVRLPGAEPINVVSGVVDVQGEEPASTDDFFRIASITKPMTSVAILQLVEEGQIELDEPVTTYLGDWLGAYPFADEITVRQLLNHTNGLIEYAFDPGFYLESAFRPTQPYTPEEILEFLSRQEPLFEPGTEYQYETGGFVAAGLIIEKLTGNSAATELRTRLFDPAGAANIYLTPQEFPPVPVVNAYARGPLYDALVLLPSIEDQGLSINDEPVLDVLAGEQAVLQSAGWTGGGLEARMESVSAVFAAMFNGTLLSEASIAEMTTKTLDVNYGLGIDVNTVDDTIVYSHGGGVPGFRSQAGYLPEHDVAYAFSASLIPLPEGGGVGELQRQLVEIVTAEG
ncbi:MAG: serine hydrolase domain-containing protein [Actinomycetota bacterium]